MATVTIIKGSSRGKAVKNQTFELIKGFTIPASGKGFVTVDGTKLYGRPTARIRVKSEKDFQINGTFEPVVSKLNRSTRGITNESAKALFETDEPEVETDETDAEILHRISRRFEILEKMTLGARSGDIRALFVTGAPGVGKTFGVEKQLGMAGMEEVFTGDKPKHQIVSGAMTPIGLYLKLYEFSDAGNVLVIDDCDMVFADEVALNLLKAALDTSKKRMIYWNVDSKSLRKEGVPNSFEFKGSVIFISNINFRKLREGRMKNHVIALMSRSHFLDLTVHTTREKMLRIEDLVTNQNMLEDFNLNKKESGMVMDFLREHKQMFNELSLRTVIKLAGLAKTFTTPGEWREAAIMSLTGNVI